MIVSVVAHFKISVTKLLYIVWGALLPGSVTGPNYFFKKRVDICVAKDDHFPGIVIIVKYIFFKSKQIVRFINDLKKIRRLKDH